MKPQKTKKAEKIIEKLKSAGVCADTLDAVKEAFELLSDGDVKFGESLKPYFDLGAPYNLARDVLPVLEAYTEQQNVQLPTVRLRMMKDERDISVIEMTTNIVGKEPFEYDGKRYSSLLSMEGK